MTINMIFRTLNSIDRLKMFLISLLQALLSVIDLAGVYLLGILASVILAGNKNFEAFKSISNLLDLRDIPVDKIVLILGILASVLLISKSIFSIILTKKVLNFLSIRCANYKNTLLKKFFLKSITEIQEFHSQELIYKTSVGVEAIFLQILGMSIILIADVATLIILFIALAFVNLTVTFLTLVFFSLIAYLLSIYLHKVANDTGKMISSERIKANAFVLEMLRAYREIHVGNKLTTYLNRINNAQQGISISLAKNSFLPYVSKYIFELALLVGTITLVTLQSFSTNKGESIFTLTIFLAAGSRIAPAIMRIQTGYLQIKGAMGLSSSTFELIDKLDKDVTAGSHKSREILNYDLHEYSEKALLSPSITLKEVLFTYSGNVRPTINGISLSIDAGQHVALVGPSGSGKSTLADLILGILIPQSGTVLISNLEPIQAIQKWPGKVAYVPQYVHIVNGTLAENVALGIPTEEINYEMVIAALKTAALDEFLDQISLSPTLSIGEDGSKLSGGQKQRIGIARALYSNPLVLILDEATSSLDIENENLISKALENMKRNRTVISIAHRYSTIKNADKIYYLDKGSILGEGKFNELCAILPEFERQVKLMQI